MFRIQLRTLVRSWVPLSQQSSLLPERGPRRATLFLLYSAFIAIVLLSLLLPIGRRSESSRHHVASRRSYQRRAGPLWLFSQPLLCGRGFLYAVSFFLVFFSLFHQLLSFSGDVTVGFFTAGWTREKGSSLLLSSSCSANLTHSRVVTE